MLSSRTLPFIKLLLFYLLCGVFFTSYAQAYDNSSESSRSASKRIEVYTLSQNYWDTRPGDSLSLIVQHLLPNNPGKRAALMQDILALNPAAFINGDINRMLADTRLWLPGYMKLADSKVDPATTIVERYSWGNIKRPRR